MKIRTINPATGEPLEEFELVTEEEMSNVIREARTASKEWRRIDIAERTKYLSKIARMLRASKTEHAEFITREMGKPLKESLAEVEKCAAAMDFFAENAEKMLQNELVKTESSKSYVTFEPLGIVFAIMPWNFPYWQVVRCGAPALMAGNTIILKHSSYVPRCALELERIFKEAGLPEHVFNTVIADSKLAEKMIQSDIDGVSFTGSMQAGSRIAELAGKNLKKFVLELGGSDPFLVLDDADIQSAAKMATIARVVNTGQSCIAAKRFIVANSVAQEFEMNLVKEMEALRIGDPSSPVTDVGPLVREDQRVLMEEFVEDAVEKGANILTGGERVIGKGFFFKPTVLANVDHSMRILNEETFGPIAPIIRVADDDDAILEANNTDFGLGASIWSKDSDRAEGLARRIEAGNVYVNKIVASDPRLPFGGIKRSGIGRELSRYGLLEFANTKTVLID